MSAVTGFVVPRFWSKVDFGNMLACWDWTGNKTIDGYGRFKTDDGQSVAAHRWAYETNVGPLIEGMEIDHLCFNRACVRPDHLEQVTPQVNNLRSGSVAAINARKTHCPNGHLYTKENTRLERQGPGKRIGRRCRACRSTAYVPLGQLAPERAEAERLRRQASGRRRTERDRERRQAAEAAEAVR